MSAEQHRAFIETVLGEMKGNATLALASKERSPSGKIRVTDYVWFSYPADLDEMVEFAVEHEYEDLYLSPLIYGNQRVIVNKDGRSTTYPTDRQGRVQWSRGKENALRSHTVYMDSDTCPPENFRLPPSVHVNTSVGHGHDYWVLLEDISAKDAAELSHKITTAHQAEGTDPSGWSANKVLRMPTVNMKNLNVDPYRITWSDSGIRYDAADVAIAYADVSVAPETGMPGPVARAPGVETVPVASRSTPAPLVASLPAFEDLVSQIPATERRLNDLIYKTPKRGEGGWQSEQRYALLLDLQRFGFSPEETVAVAWQSPAAEKWREDDRGIEGLWMEANKAAMEIAVEKGAGVSAAPPKPKPTGRSPKLLSAAERSHIERREDFISDYILWAKSKVPVFNQPLHESNAWVILSLTFSECAYIPKPNEPLPLNLYVMQLAPSSSGKSEAKGLMFSVINKLFPTNNPDIGGNHSNNALIEALLERNNQVSFIHSDEAHGRIAEMKNGGWQTGMQELYAHIYDGKLPQLGRVGRKELRLPDARTLPIMHMSGTLTGMLKVLEHYMFTSGWLARQIFVIGDTTEVTEEDMMPLQVFGDVQKTYEQMPLYWSTMFFRTRELIRAGLKPGQRQMPVHMTDEASARFKKARWQLVKHFQENFSDQELFRPMVNRMQDIMWKAAALLALSEGEHIITTEHILAALSYTEGWLADVITVAEGIAETTWARMLNDIEHFIGIQKNQEAELGAIYRQLHGHPTRFVDEWLTALLKQGRVTVSGGNKGAPTWYHLKR